LVPPARESMRCRDILARHTSPASLFRPMLLSLKSVGLLAQPSVVASQAACVLAAGTRASTSIQVTMSSMRVQCPLLVLRDASKCLDARFTCPSIPPDRPSCLGFIGFFVVQAVLALTITLFTSTFATLSFGSSRIGQRSNHGTSAIAPYAFFCGPCWRPRSHQASSGRALYTPSSSHPRYTVSNLAQIVCDNFTLCCYQTRNRRSHKPAPRNRSNDS
jgi:hypothetical protein